MVLRVKVLKSEANCIYMYTYFRIIIFIHAIIRQTDKLLNDKCRVHHPSAIRFRVIALISSVCDSSLTFKVYTFYLVHIYLSLKTECIGMLRYNASSI